MLTKVHVQHYKAFENAEVPIKPITILLGANSVGKSSIVQLLLMLQQTAQENTGSYTSALKIYGGLVNLGSTENIFHKLNTSEPVVISLSLKNESLIKDFHGRLKRYLEEIRSAVGMFPIAGLLALRDKKLTTKKEYFDFISDFKAAINKDTVRIYRERLSYFRFSGLNLSLSDIMTSDKEQLERIYDYLLGLAALPSDHFEFKFRVCYQDRTKLAIESFSLGCGEKCLLSYDIKGSDIDIYSDFVDFKKSEMANIQRNFSKLSTIFNCFNENDSYLQSSQQQDVISAYTLDIVNTSLRIFMSDFRASKINYVSPLRAHPKRYYMLDKAKVSFSIDTLDGDAIAEVLKENGMLKRRVNKWLEKFGLSVNVEEFKEVIHHLKVNQNGLNLDITDVGFGISQVLPIIIQGFLSKNDSLTIIEQPEIHLHPKMQADLADLFIDMIKTYKEKQIIIETHSEYLLRRLRRRISEDRISAEKVAICLFHPQTKTTGAVVENLNIQEKGFFEWPEDFYDGELSNDITEFLKNQQ